jgi:tripartite ATP-independent transporter DctP family solute receptor
MHFAPGPVVGTLFSLIPPIQCAARAGDTDMTIRRTFIQSALVVACSGLTSLAGAQTMLKAADVHPAGYPTVVAVENMGKKLDAATQGRYKFQMFPGSVLGGEKEMIEQTQVGAIQLLRTSLGPVGPVVPEVNVFNMPFVFRDIDHMRAVIDGPIGQELLDKVTASPAKLVALAWMDGGSRSLYTKKPVRTPADLKGQKIRMMGNPLFVDTMNAMGGNGIAMGYGEVFTAIQTGVVDGAENNPPSLYTANHFKAGAKYYTQTNHLIIPELLVMSKVAWDKLSPADQALVKKLGREAQMEQRKLWDAAVADYTTKLKAEGVEFIKIDNKPFFDATAPVRAKYGAEFADLMKRIADVK